MSLIDDLIARGGFGGAPAPGMLNLSPAIESEIDPATGARVPKGMVLNPVTGQLEPGPRVASKWGAPIGGPPDAQSRLRASAGVLTPNAPFSAGAGADIPFSRPTAAEDVTPPSDSVPLPRPRPAAPPTSLAPPAAEDSALPAKSAPAEGEMPTAEPGILDKLTSALGNNSSTLIALGAGLAGAPNVGQGISRALGAALPAQQADLKRQMLLSGQQATFRSLVQAGVPRQQAMAALQNPKLLEALSSRYLIDPKLETKTIKDEWGAEHIVTTDPYTGQIKSRDGVPVTDQGGAASGAPSASTPTSAFYAPGVTAIDQTKVGDDYLAQFSPEMQRYVHAYIDGGVMPTGRQQLMQRVKMIAQKYGGDLNIPVDDNIYNERKAYMTELGKNAPSTAGGQGKAFSQALDHFAKASDAAVAMGNWNLGLVDPSHWVNAFRNQFTSQRDASNKMQSEIQTGAGETGKLFSGSTGGGVHERQDTRNRFSPYASGPETAGAFEGTLETMEGGLNALHSRRDRLFPHGAPQGAEFLGPEEQANIDKIRRNIELLRGKQPEQIGAPVSRGAAGPDRAALEAEARRRGLIP